MAGEETVDFATSLRALLIEKSQKLERQNLVHQLLFLLLFRSQSCTVLPLDRAPKMTGTGGAWMGSTDGQLR